MKDEACIHLPNTYAPLWGVKSDELIKNQGEDPRWLDKKFDIQGVVFLAGSRPYIRYAEGLPKTCNAGDRTFYEAIKSNY